LKIASLLNADNAALTEDTTDNVSYVGTSPADLCKESWDVTQTNGFGKACVLWEFEVKRLLNTLDTADDLVLTYDEVGFKVRASFTQYKSAGATAGARILVDAIGGRNFRF